MTCHFRTTVLMTARNACQITNFMALSWRRRTVICLGFCYCWTLILALTNLQLPENAPVPMCTMSAVDSLRARSNKTLLGSENFKIFSSFHNIDQRWWRSVCTCIRTLIMGKAIPCAFYSTVQYSRVLYSNRAARKKRGRGWSTAFQWQASIGFVLL